MNKNFQYSTKTQKDQSDYILWLHTIFALWMEKKKAIHYFTFENSVKNEMKSFQVFHVF